MQCVPALDKAPEALVCECPQRASMSSAGKGRVVGEKLEDTCARSCGKWFGAIPIQSNIAMVPAVSADTAVYPFMTEHPRSTHQFCTTGFFRESTMKSRRLLQQRKFYLEPMFCENTAFLCKTNF